MLLGDDGGRHEQGDDEATADPVRAPGVAQLTASNMRIQRSASWAMAAPDGTSGRSRSTAWSPTV